MPFSEILGFGWYFLFEILTNFLCFFLLLFYYRGYVGIHSSGFRDFLLKPELVRAIVDSGFEHPSEGKLPNHYLFSYFTYLLWTVWFLSLVWFFKLLLLRGFCFLFVMFYCMMLYFIISKSFTWPVGWFPFQVISYRSVTQLILEQYSRFGKSFN